MDPIIIWDEEDDPDGNYVHIVTEGHGITADEVDEVLRNKANETVPSDSSGYPVTFGWTTTGKHIAVVWENALDNPWMIYPITAYETPPKKRRRR